MQDKFYVTMTDSFLSGWGMANGKTNKLVIECDSYDEAQIVAENAGNRSEMKYVKISSSKPSYNSDQFKVSFHTKADYGRWFQKGAF